MLNIVTLNVAMLNVVMLNVVMLNVQPSSKWQTLMAPNSTLIETQFLFNFWYSKIEMLLFAITKKSKIGNVTFN